jgi:hypothetical protein
MPAHAAIALSILFLGPEIVRMWRGEQRVVRHAQDGVDSGSLLKVRISQCVGETARRHPISNLRRGHVRERRCRLLQTPQSIENWRYRSSEARWSEEIDVRKSTPSHFTQATAARNDDPMLVEDPARCREGVVSTAFDTDRRGYAR